MYCANAYSGLDRIFAVISVIVSTRQSGYVIDLHGDDINMKFKKRQS